MRKYNTHDNDIYLLEYNLLNIQNYEQLREAESLVFSIRAARLSLENYPFDFTQKGLKQLHKYLFQDIYSFAGKFRDVQLIKGATRFCQAQYIHIYADGLFQQLQKEARWNSLEEAANRLAYYKSELNMLHPFRKGNDRTIRIFIHAFAKSRGVEWSYETMDREKYLNVMIRATHDTQPLQQLFFETISYIE